MHERTIAECKASDDNICTIVMDVFIMSPMLKTGRITPHGARKPCVRGLDTKAFTVDQLMEFDMKTLFIAFACLPLLAACNKEADAPATMSTTAPVAETPAETSTATPPAALPPASQEPAPGAATTDNMSTSGSSAAGSSAAGASEGSGGGMYVVSKGDTLWGIAEKNGISHGDLAKWNNIGDPRELQVGRELRLAAP